MDIIIYCQINTYVFTLTENYYKVKDNYGRVVDFKGLNTHSLRS